MTVATGDKFPAITLKTPGVEGPQDFNTGDAFAGKKVVLFGVPGAFTPGCSLAHLPGFVVNADKIKAKGVDTIACMAVNDAFVMGAWGKDQNADEIVMLGDGNGELTAALGLEMDGSGFCMGKRCKRFAMIIDDGVISFMAIDDKGIEATAAENILAQL